MVLTTEDRDQTRRHGDAATRREESDGYSENGHPVDPNAPSGNGHSGRDGRGRFTKGNRGGPGNPFARQTATLRRVALDAVTEEDLYEIVRGIVARSKEGDLAAAKFLFTHIVGKPAEAVNPDTLDQQEWQIYQQTAVHTAEFNSALHSMPARMACDAVEGARPILLREMAEQYQKDHETMRPGDHETGDRRPELERRPGKYR